MVSVISPDQVVISTCAAGEDPFSASSTDYSELLGASGINIKGGDKDYELIVTYASSASNRYHGVDKTATMVEVSIESAIFNFDDLKDYIYSSTDKLGGRTTNTVCLGIQLTQDGGTVEKHKFDNARIVSFEISGASEEQVKGNLVFKCLPTDYTFTTA